MNDDHRIAWDPAVPGSWAKVMAFVAEHRGAHVDIPGGTTLPYGRHAMNGATINVVPAGSTVRLYVNSSLMDCAAFVGGKMKVDGVDAVLCKTCGDPTTYTGTKHCNDCHEVEMRLDGYLRRGGNRAREFVVDALGMRPVEVETARAIVAAGRAYVDRKADSAFSTAHLANFLDVIERGEWKK